MPQMIGFLALFSLSIMMYRQYLKDKEKYRICKELAVYELALAIINLLLIFIY